jgi:hypothetical protein
MIPENQLLGSLRESSLSWFRPANVHLTNEQLLELRDEEKSIYFGCWNGYNGPEWGMQRYKNLSDLENEHGKALHVKVNWNGTKVGIQFENKWFSFKGMKSSEKKIEGINDLPIETTQEGRCEGAKKDGERCKRYSPCKIKGHSKRWD